MVFLWYIFFLESNSLCQNIIITAKNIYFNYRMPNVLAVMLVYSLNSLTHVWGSTLLTLTLAPLRISQSAIGIMTIASILVQFLVFYPN